MAVVAGADGWLFLAGGTNDTLAYSTGVLEVDESVPRGWHRLLELREAWLARRNVAFYAYIAPNKEVVYADRLPAHAGQISEDRPARLIERRLASSPHVRLSYPLDELISARVHHETYPSHDTHWNGWGAFVFYRIAMSAIAVDFPAVRVLDHDDLAFEEREGLHDLGAKLDPPETAPTVAARVRAPGSAVTRDNGIINNGRVVATECPASSGGPKMLIFHDSFHDWTRPLFAESFPTTVSAHNYRMDFDLIERERPDIVLVEITERFLIRVPDDATGTTTEQLGRAKQTGLLAADDAVPYR